MITKADLQYANEELKADARERLGEPPAAEELLAYSRGELSPARAERVRELLVCYPELARALTLDFPSAEEAGWMPEEELDRHWAAMQSRAGIGRPREGRVVQFWRTAAAVAAVLAAVFGILLVRTHSDAQRLERELTQPREVSIEPILLAPDGRRGVEEPLSISSTPDSLLLVVPPINGPREAAYRIEMLATGNGSRVVWSSNSVQPREDNTFQVLVPSGSLPRGHYQLVVYGVDGARNERLATYNFRLL